MEGWVDLGGWLYQDGFYPPTDSNHSPIQVLTGPDVEYVDRDQLATTKPDHHD